METGVPASSPSVTKLTVGEPIVLEGICDACKDKHSIHEIQAVLLQICGALSL
jgi:hypothetical protein